MTLGGVGGLGVGAVGGGEGDVEDEVPEDAGEGGVACPELEGVAQAEREDLGVWVGPGGLPGCGSPGR